MSPFTIHLKDFFLVSRYRRLMLDDSSLDSAVPGEPQASNP